jgi:antitoxin HigA-1
MPIKKLKPVHPGEILQEEFLKPLKISQYRLAKETSVSAIRISEIVRKTRSVSADTALRLGKYFSTSAEFWLNLQAHYDLAICSDKISEDLKYKVKVFKTEKNEKNLTNA